MARAFENEPPKRTDNGHRSPTYVTPEEDARTVLVNAVSWSAVFAGVAVSLVAQLLLNMLGVGIGAGSVDVAGGDSPTANSFSIGAGVWWAVCGIIAAAAGGYTAGRLSGRPDASTAAWHGLTSWAFTTLVLFYLLSTTVGSLMGGAVSAVSTAAGGLGRGVAQVAAPAVAKAADPIASIEQQVRANAGDANAQRDLATSAVRALLTGDEAQKADARTKAVQALAKAQNIPEDQARTLVTGYEQQYQQTVDKAKQTATTAADKASRVVSWSMISAVIALLLGAWAAWWAGREAAVSPNLGAFAQRIRARTG